MHPTPDSGAERLLRGLATGEPAALDSVLSPVLAGPDPHRLGTGTLPPPTARLVHLAGLLALGASTTSLRWAVELALRAGAKDQEIVAVLAIVAPTAGSARVVAAAPRLALAIGYDIEVDGWDGF